MIKKILKVFILKKGNVSLCLGGIRRLSFIPCTDNGNKIRAKTVGRPDSSADVLLKLGLKKGNTEIASFSF
jgi:hypothetical protein